MSDKTFRIVIARTGSFTDSQGRPQRFSESDLDAIATSYNPKQLEAPLVFGHPTVSDPAFGWVKGLQREGGNLFAQLAQVPESVRQLVHDGRYKYVSMSLMPDRKTLRHVGLLGAAVPAIDGLGPVALSGGDADIVTINFAAGGNMPAPEEQNTRVRELEAKIRELETELATYKKKAGDAEQKEASTASEFAAYKKGITVRTREERMDALVKGGKVRPAERITYMNMASSLAKSGDSHDFAASDGTIQKMSAEEQLFRELESREPSPLLLNFSAGIPPAHVASGQTISYQSTDFTSKM